MAYDIIGDIHGHGNALIELLEGLGYCKNSTHYYHPERQAVFVGDFIDRGPNQKLVIETVKSMVENGTAHAVMGNHEFNALAYHTPDPRNKSTYLRPRSNKNTEQHLAFLSEYLSKPDELSSVLDWFHSLPMWKELDGLRIIHACWDDKCIKYIKQHYSEEGFMCKDLLHLASVKGSKEFDCIETLLKGKEIPLPDGEIFYDKMGTPRTDIRVRWWDNTAKTYREAYMGPEVARSSITNNPINVEHLVEYKKTELPVFLGHYWLDGKPARLAQNIACIDYSVAKPDGKLVAYRWDGEKEIINDNYFFL